MKFPNVWGCGSLFAFSGMDGQNASGRDFVGMTMEDPVTLRFDAPKPVTLFIPAPGGAPDCLLSDAIRWGDVSLVFLNANAVLGESDAPPALSGGEREVPGLPAIPGVSGVEGVTSGENAYLLCRRGKRFALACEKTVGSALDAALAALEASPKQALKQRLSWSEAAPPCPRPEYERLYYKCLSVQRVNLYSPNADFSLQTSTPDRLPQRHVWLWDSMFHALAYAKWAPKTAKETVAAVLLCQRDGFLPHMIKSPDDVSAITQPPVVSWATEEVYKATGDRDFLAFAAPKAASFLDWFIKNRDENADGLPEWRTDFTNVRCRCDESGMDNSPRFDVNLPLNAVDAACFLAHDAKCLSRCFAALGKREDAEKWRRVFDGLRTRINAVLWDEALGAYTDHSFDGRSTGVTAVTSFLPLFAGAATPERAKRLVSLLKDERRFASALPVPSVSMDHPAFDKDMWRGGVWLNYNYMIARGLREYGYVQEADAIREKTLSAVYALFLKTGNIYEFYDPDDRIDPRYLPRKGPQPEKPDYRKKIHAITDYHWSAAFLLLWLTE